MVLFTRVAQGGGRGSLHPSGKFPIPSRSLKMADPGFCKRNGVEFNYMGQSSKLRAANVGSLSGGRASEKKFK